MNRINVASEAVHITVNDAGDTITLNVQDQRFMHAALSRTITDAVSWAMANAEGGQHIFHFYLTGRKTAVEVVKEINDMTRQAGKSPLLL